MPDPTTLETLTSSVLSAVALRELQPEWSDNIIDEWLNLIDSLVIISETIDLERDKKIEDIATDFVNGAIPYAESGNLTTDAARFIWNSIEYTLEINGAVKTQGRIKGSVVVFPAMSPYSIQATDETILADTNTGNIVLNLPEGFDGDSIRIMNTGVSGNTATITTYLSETLYSSTNSFDLYDLEHLDLQYEITLGWN